MNKEIIEERIKMALKTLLVRDAILLDPKLDINERTVTHKLAIYIESLFPKYDVDCEFNRMFDDSIDEFVKKSIDIPKIESNDILEDTEARTVYPDIIIHDRNLSGKNLLAIEVKLGWKNSKGNFDLIKIRAYKLNLKYQYCVYIELGPGNEYKLHWV